jgi:hypothetical protein
MVPPFWLIPRIALTVAVMFIVGLAGDFLYESADKQLKELRKKEEKKC